MTLLTADFETTTSEDDCRVWAYGICEVGNPDYFTYGNNIDDFMEYCKTSKNSTFYFHNLKFDGEFIIVWLFEHGFKHVVDKHDLETKTFSTLINNKGQFYSIKIIFEKKGKKTKFITIYDSLKILPFSIEEIGEGFKLGFEKIKVDKEFYHIPRPIGHKLTDLEVKYLKHDVTIPSMALDVLFKQELNKMTQGSNALHDYKQTIGLKRFEQWFPTPDYDIDIRHSYRGGFTYLNPKFKEIDVDEGIVLDVNSLYPWVMRNKRLPYGEGIYFDGQYKADKLYNLYVQMFTCQFELKPDHIPTVQLKNTLSFIPTDYIESSGDIDVTMCMTSVDLELFFEHYDVYNIEYHNGWKFKSTIGMFTEYIDKWTKVKIESKQTGNYAMYILAKLMLNALYGKFALNPNIQSKIPYYDKGIIKYRDGAKETRKPIYIPVGTFITSWARYTTITSAQSVYDRFIYADTDSLHLIGTELPEGLNIDPVELGAWDNEATFMRARFLRQKSYFESHIVSDKKYDKMEEEEKEKCYIYKGVRVIDKITCAGMPDSCYQYVTWDNFHVGKSYDGKLQMEHVKGGIILNETDFTIRN